MSLCIDTGHDFPAYGFVELWLHTAEEKVKHELHLHSSSPLKTGPKGSTDLWNCQMKAGHSSTKYLQKQVSKGNLKWQDHCCCQVKHKVSKKDIPMGFPVQRGRKTNVGLLEC